MKGSLHIFALLTLLIAASFSFLNSNSNLYAFTDQKTVGAYGLTTEELKANDEINKKRAARIDQSVTQVEQQVQEISQGFQSGSIWKRTIEQFGIRNDGKYKTLGYVIDIPAYILRFATWPPAVATDYLIKKGAARKIINLVSNKERTFWVYPKMEFGFGSGFGGGIGIKHFDLFHRQYQLTASYQIHINLNQEVYAAIQKNGAFHLWDKPVSFKFLNSYVHHHEMPFYGIGITSSQNYYGQYSVDDFMTGGWMGLSPLKKLMFRWNTYMEWGSTGTSGEDKPSITQQFPRSQTPGLYRSIYYIKFGPSIVHDTRNSAIVPDSGGVQEFAFYRHQGTNITGYDFNEYAVNAEQFFKALFPRHVLVLRNAWNFQQTTGSGAVPFFLLNRLDMTTPLRGFGYGRFTDTSSVIFNIAYRFPVWEHMDGEFFFDTGRTFHGPTDFSFKHFKYGGGSGLRFRTNNYFLARMQIGYGGEGVKFYLKTTQEF